MKLIGAAIVLGSGLVVLPCSADDQDEGSVADRPSGSGYSVTWSRLAGGGALAEGDNYQLHGTVGQHEVQPEPAPDGNNFAVRAGFWIVLRQSEPAIIDLIFRDRFRSE